MQAYSFSKDGKMIAGLQVQSLDEMRAIAQRFNRRLKSEYRHKAESRWNFSAVIGDARTIGECQSTLTVKGGANDDLYTQAA